MNFRRSLFIILLFVAPIWASATHVVGGSLTYEHLGGSTYRISFKMYRDCAAGNATLPTQLTVEVRRGDNSTFTPDKEIVLPRTQVGVLNPSIDTCAFDPGICVEEAIYTTIVNNLPPGQGGYHLYFGYCCRNWTIVNVPVTPGVTGASYYTFIPENNVVLTNSSPTWKNFPPVFVCQGNLLEFDHGATDKDGDSLAYSFYNPFDDNNPTPPLNLNGSQFLPVGYNVGYTFNDPLGGGGFAVNPATGMITGTPPALGQYVVGVQVDEYRNGVIINTVYRDFQFNVISCPPIPVPGIGPTTGCSGLAVPFTNTSTPLVGNSFYWDFGDLSTTTDNSTLTNPTYAYPTIGTYIVMLVAQAGTPCADTIYDTLIVSGIVPDFTYTDSACVNDPVNFFDASVPSINATTTSWNWNFGDAGTAVIPAPTHTYTTPGTYTVQLIVSTDLGCIDSISKTMFIQSLPVALVTDTFACVSNPVTNLNGLVFGATGGLWVNSLGGFSPNTADLNAAYTPTAAELAAGFATLTLSTTGNGFCPADLDTMILSFSIGVTADAGPDTSICKDNISIFLGGIITTAGGGQWSTSGSGTFSPNAFDLNASYNPSTADTAAGTVDIYLTSIGNGNCLPAVDTLTITFTAVPVSTILSNDTACAGSIFIPVTASSTTGNGYWQTLGSGFFSPNDSLNSTSYFADSLDNFNGNVTLIFTSTNNGGCQSYGDTLNIELIPAPAADYSFVSVCPGDTVFFTDLSTAVDPITNWDWDFGNTFIDNIPNTNTIYDTAGTYTVSLITSSINGCIDTSIQSVLVYSFPDANFGFNGVCEGTNSVFTDSSIVNGSTISLWDWDFGDATGTDNVQNPAYTYAISGSYNVDLIVQSSQGCWDTISKTVFIQAPPTAGFNSAPGSVKINQLFSFSDISFVNVIDWQWNFGDGVGTSSQQHPTYSYTDAGNYRVCLTVTDVLGCIDSICDDVIVFMPPAVPNAFSPNGKGGNNTFNVLGGPYKELEFKIYNNWGELIFESNDQSVGWDGRRDGAEQPIGVYIYTVKAVTLNDEPHTLTGDVTLLR